jgi:hypothetical protein
MPMILSDDQVFNASIAWYMIEWTAINRDDESTLYHAAFFHAPTFEDGSVSVNETIFIGFFLMGVPVLITSLHSAVTDFHFWRNSRPVSTVTSLGASQIRRDSRVHAR